MVIMQSILFINVEECSHNHNQAIKMHKHFVLSCFMMLARLMFVPLHS